MKWGHHGKFDEILAPADNQQDWLHYHAPTHRAITCCLDSSQAGSCKIGDIGSPANVNFNFARFLSLKRIFDRIRHLEGDIVECGVGRGDSLLQFAYFIREEGKSRNLWGFDSFEGFPEPTLEDVSPRHSQKGDWSDTSLYGVMQKLTQAGFDAEFVRAHVTLVKGFFTTSLVKYTGNKIALLHLDVDLYSSYSETLNTLFPRVVQDGAILFDEVHGYN